MYLKSRELLHCVLFHFYHPFMNSVSVSSLFHMSPFFPLLPGDGEEKEKLFLLDSTVGDMLLSQTRIFVQCSPATA